MDGLKFQYLDISNFKKINRKVLEIGGRSFLIIGKNGAGKSSLIQAMLSPLDTAYHPDVAITEGEEKGRIEVTIGGTINGVAKKYTMEVYFSAKDNKGKLTLVNESGEKISAPKTFLKELIGGISFDVMEFVNASKTDKIKTLRELSGVSEAIYAKEHDIKKCRDNKSYLETRRKELEAFISEHNLSQEYIKKYEKEVSLEDINNALAAAQKANKNFNEVQHGVLERENMINIRNKSIEAKRKNIERMMREIAQENSEIETLEAENARNASEIEKGKAWMEARPAIDTSSIIEQMNAALAHNNEVKKIAEVATKHAEINEVIDKITLAEKELKKAMDARDKVINESKLPVKGLSWSDSDVFLNGLPFEENQISKSVILETGLEIAMAMNPKLKAIFLHDASLFDHDHLQSVIKKVEERGYQLIAEVVGDNADIDIKFSEEVV